MPLLFAAMLAATGYCSPSSEELIFLLHVNALLLEHCSEGLEKDLHVKQERQMVDVIHVEGKPIVPRQRIATVRLSVARNARRHFELATLIASGEFRHGAGLAAYARAVARGLIEPPSPEKGARR